MTISKHSSGFLASTLVLLFASSSANAGTASLSGTVTLEGIDTYGGNVVRRNHRIALYGTGYQTTTIERDGPYSFTNLEPGTYRIDVNTTFNPDDLPSPSASQFTEGGNSSLWTQVTLADGESGTLNFSKSLGAISGAINFSGLWNLDNVRSDLNGNARVDYRTWVANSCGWCYPPFDYLSYATSELNDYNGYFAVVPINESASLSSWYLRWSEGSTTWTVQHQYFDPQTSPIQATLSGPVDPEIQYQVTGVPAIDVTSSEAELVIDLVELGINNSCDNDGNGEPDPLGISSVDFRAGSSDRATTIQSFTDITGDETNPLTILVRGEPGTYNYRPRTTITDSCGGSHIVPLIVNLGLPQSTPTGTTVSQDYANDSGAYIGSVTFENVISGGQTTMSTSSDGPAAPTGFKLSSATPQYFDIRSSAEFLSAEVCFDYEGVTNPDLSLYHYECVGETDTDCTWVDITSLSSPHATSNTICGMTTSFSIFALMEPAIVDDDEDGILNDVDNCLLTFNPDQEDFDGDGIGDACDSDADEDGIPNDEDTCPFFPNANNNNDLDGDGSGDACDHDDDGDGIDDLVDNCPLIANEDQANFDGDPSGDQCDTDDDNDGVLDGTDMCEETPLGVMIESHGCSSAQAFVWKCPNDADYRNHGMYMKCIVKEADRQVDIGLLEKSEHGHAISTAAQSSTGK